MDIDFETLAEAEVENVIDKMQGAYEGSFLNIEKMDVDIIFDLFSRFKDFQAIGDHWEVERVDEKDRTCYHFSHIHSIREEKVVVKDTGNVVQPRSPKKALMNPFVWYVKIKYYSDFNRSYFPISDREELGAVEARKYHRKDTDHDVIRITDKYGNKVQIDKADWDKLQESVEIEEYDEPKQNFKEFKLDVMNDPQILVQNKDDLAKDYGVTRRTIDTWFDRLKEASLLDFTFDDFRHDFRHNKVDLSTDRNDLADRYNVSRRQIQNWISKLKEDDSIDV